MKFLKKLFAPRYTPWAFSETVIEDKPVMTQVEDPRYNPKGTKPTDPIDFMSVPTGFVEKVRYDIYVKRHLKTGLPKYKKIKIHAQIIDRCDDAVYSGTSELH